MLELDLLLLPFFEEEFANLSSKMQLTFVRLLEQDDPDLLLWFSNKSEPEDSALAELVRLILDRVQP
jgi:antitoxin CptB